MFKVADVETNTKPMKHVSIDADEILAGSPRDGMVECASEKGNMLARAIEEAFYNHRPLKLSPEVIRLQIVHGFGEHINQNSEFFRHKFVDHEDQAPMELFDENLLPDSPPELWRENLLRFEQTILDKTKTKISIFHRDFTTTTVDTKIACVGALMDTMRSYFRYGLMGGCGIPYVRLTGTPDDWAELRDSVKQLREIDPNLDWWLDELDPVLLEFHRASAGNPDTEFWKSAFRVGGDSGDNDYMNGWIVALFPYIQGPGGPVDVERKGTIIKITLATFSEREEVEIGLDNTVTDLQRIAPPYMKMLWHDHKVLSKGTIGENGICDGSSIICMVGTEVNRVRNSRIAGWRDGSAYLGRSEVLPSLKSVTIPYRNIADGTEFSTEFVSGMIGLDQDQNGEISPRVGWFLKKM